MRLRRWWKQGATWIHLADREPHHDRDGRLDASRIAALQAHGDDPDSSSRLANGSIAVGVVRQDGVIVQPSSNELVKDGDHLVVVEWE